MDYFLGTSDLARLFPIETQTSKSDKRFLLDAMRLMGDQSGNYSYLEIGSFLGGSLAPFLMDSKCTSVLSIDERGRALPDERGINYDYTGISEETMRRELDNCGLATEKLQTFDGSVDAYSQGDSEHYNLAFIDGEHTDVACFRDFLWTQSLTPSDAVIMFHDSSLVYKALQLIIVHLEKSGVKFKLIKKADSEMSACLLGSFCKNDCVSYFGEQQDLSSFFNISEINRIMAQVQNRVRWHFARHKIKQLKIPLDFSVIPPRTVKGFKTSGQ